MGLISRRRTCPPPSWLDGGEGDPEMVPTFTMHRLTGEVPSFAPAVSPRVRRRPSPWPPHRHSEPASESTTHKWWSCTADRPISTRLEPASRLRSFPRWFTTAFTPSRLACRTRAVWRCRPVPALSGLLPPSPASPGSGCPQLQRPAATGPRWSPFTSTRYMAPRGAPERHESVGTALAGGPPRRSQRAELPHWAPGSGQTSHGPTPRRDVINAPLSPAPVRRTRSGTCGTPDPALCPGRVVPSGFPSPRPLPSTTSAAMGLVRRLRRYYEAIRLPTLVHPRRTATAFPGRPNPDQRAGQPWDLPVLAHRDSLHAKVL